MSQSLNSCYPPLILPYIIFYIFPLKEFRLWIKCWPTSSRKIVYLGGFSQIGGGGRVVPSKGDVGKIPKIRNTFCGPYNKDYKIVGSCSDSPTLGHCQLGSGAYGRDLPKGAHVVEKLLSAQL